MNAVDTYDTPRHDNKTRTIPKKQGENTIRHKGGGARKTTHPSLTARLANCADEGERDRIPSRSHSLGPRTRFHAEP